MQHCLLIEGANYNHKTFSNYVDISIICFEKTFKKLEKSIYKNIYVVQDLSDLDEISKHISNARDYNFVSSFSEFNQALAAKISDKFNIPGYNLFLIQFLENKHLIREKMFRSGLSTIRSVQINTFDEILDYALNHNLPFILKPLHGIGGYGVIKVSSWEQCSSFKDYCFKNYLIEPFIEGREYSIESYSYKGEHRILTVTEKIIDDKMNEIGHILPALLPEIQLKKIDVFLKALNKCLKIDNGVGHTEIKITESGEVELIETHARMGGGMMGKLMDSSFGLNVIDCWGLSIQEDRIYELDNVWNGIYSQIFSKFPKESGKVVNLFIPQFPKDLSVFIWKKVGDFVKEKGNQNRIVSIIQIGESYEELMKTYPNHLDKIQLEIRSDVYENCNFC